MTYEPTYCSPKQIATFDERELVHKAEMLLKREAPAGKSHECRLRAGEKAVAIVAAQEIGRLWECLDKSRQLIARLETKLGYRDQE